MPVYSLKKATRIRLLLIYLREEPIVIKGVNRQMIEVTQTNSPFYERALFVVKPEYTQESYEALHREATQVLESLGAPSAFRRKNKVLFWGVRLGAAALAGAGIALAVMAL